MATSQQWISKREAARRLGLPEKTIDRRRLSGELASFKLRDAQTGHVRISADSLDAYVERRQGLLGAEAAARRDSTRCRSRPWRRFAPPRQPPAAAADAAPSRWSRRHEAPSETPLKQVERDLRRKPRGAQQAVGEGIYMRLDQSGRRRFLFRRDALVVIENKRVQARLEQPRGCMEIQNALAPWLR